MKRIIIPSLIAKNQKQLTECFNKVKNTSKLFHLDVIDGKLAPNKSLTFNFKLPKTKAKFEAHLMLKNPESWIKKHHKKVQTIIIHSESDNFEKSLVLAIKKKKKVGLAINPKTKIEKIKPYIKEINQVLILSVNPGFYGGKFIPTTLKKVKQLRKISSKIKIEVDGSMNEKTIKKAAKAGASLFVVGSYLQKSKDSLKAFKTLKHLVK